LKPNLVDAMKKKLRLAWSAREAKAVGKGKETVQKTQEIPYNEIKEAIVTIKF
jgi:ribosome maturation factor RimP